MVLPSDQAREIPGPSGAARPRSSIAQPRAGFRPDIEGLRAVAVLVVLAFHVGVPGFGGGYVGVDVFFVISGFLITGGLLRAHEATTRVSFLDFYARRVRRILPASSLVLVATLVGAALVQNPLYQRETAADVRAAALFSSNIRFADQATDYFHAGAALSPVQNYWSLSLEEQFYVLWPAVLAVALVVLARRLPGSPRTWALVAVTAVLVGSLAVSVVSSPDSDAAFFLLAPRAWELAAGGLVALVAIDGIPVIGERVARVLAVVGSVMVVAAVASFDATTVFPGWAALVPVVGTCLVLLAGAVTSSGPVGRLLSLRPLEVIGGCSYSLYLWHWPVLVLAGVLYPSIATVWTRGALVTLIVTGPLAVATYHLVEKPVRFHPALRDRPRLALLVGLGLVVGVVAATFGYAAVTGGRVLATDQAAPVEGQFDGVVHATEFVPENLVPRLGESSTVQLTPCPDRGVCRYGPADGRRVVLFGDSHALHWQPAFEVAADREGLAVEQWVFGACGSFLFEALTPSAACDAWRERAFEELRGDPPEMVVLSNLNLPQYREDPVSWEAGVRETMRSLPEGSEVVVLGATPATAAPVPPCLAEHLDRTAACETRRVSELHDLNGRLGRIVESEGGRFVDVASWMCTEDRCPVVIGNTLVLADLSHLTAEFARTRADAMGAALR